MAIYSILGNSLNNTYGINSNELTEAYDINSNIIFRGGKDPYIDGRTLLFEDDFSGDSLNENNWSYEIGNVRGSELQFYRSQNIVVKNSNLIIKALRETHLNKGWTSGSITGQLKKSWLYGRFEAKIKFPNVVGAFGAFWTLGANHWIEYKSDDDESMANSRPDGSVTWPLCGEIDVVESIPGNTLRPPANLWDNTGASLGSTRFDSDIDIGQYHIYSMEWTSEYIEMLIDNHAFKRWTFSDYDEVQIAAYKLPQYILLNLAVGGAGGTPDQSINEMKMYVDWVRVYAPLDDKTFSVLGDSYSTYDGDVSPSTNAVWYDGEKNNVSDKSMMWYRLYEQATDNHLVMNNSYSGSPICYDGYGSGNADAEETCFLARMNNLAIPSTIFIFGGTNDSWIGVTQGEYKYSDWLESDFVYFRPALAYLLNNLQTKHSNARIVFIKNNGLSATVSTSIDTICAHYGVTVISLSNIDKSDGHPTATGMQQIASQVRLALND